MDTRNSRSRSQTPFTQVELKGFIEKESYTEQTNVRATRRTSRRLEETSSSVKVSSTIEKPVRKSARSVKTDSKWYKTSDYSSEDGENEVSSTRTITQNEKNQLVEDARAAANGSNEVSALNLYKKSGRYWDVYPKTDWTYSHHSKDRTELAPGIVAMPNMSRKTIHSVQSTEGSFDYSHKETNTEEFSHRDEYDEYMPRQLFNNNYDKEYRSYKSTTFLHRMWLKLKNTWVSTLTSIVTIFYFIFGVQTSWLTKLHTFTSRVMLLDTWLLWKNGAVNKTARLIALCLVPLIMLGGCCILMNLGTILNEAYFNSSLFTSSETKKTAHHFVDPVPLLKDEENVVLKNVKPMVDSKVLNVPTENNIASLTPDEIASKLSVEQLKFISQSLRNSQSIKESYDVDEMVEYIVKSPSFQNVFHRFQHDTVNIDSKNLVKRQQSIIDTLQSEISKLKQDIQEIEKSRKEDFNKIISQIKADNVQNSARLNVKLNRCCRKPIVDVEAHIKRTLAKLFSDTDFTDDHKGLNAYFNSIYVAKQDLENQLLNLTSNLNSKYATLIENNSLGLMDTISENIKLEMNRKLKSFKTETHNHRNEAGVPTISEEHVRKIVKDALSIYDADKTGLVDYAMETMGGQILTTRCTENYHYGKAVVSVLGIPLWYPVNSPRTVITPSINPGECWAFQNFPGFAVIRLSKRIKVDAFSLEHISKLLVPNGEIDSAPKQFEVYGLVDENDKEPLKLGEYVYDYDGEALQFFEVQNIGHIFEIIELRVLSNWGNPNYTCLYRFRVHGESSL